MDLSLILDIITVVAVILGILFGLVQLRHYHLSREREAALLLLNSFQTVEFFQGLWTIQELPKGLTKNQIEESVGEEIRLVYLVMSSWESIGILIFNREISIKMVDDAYGNSIIVSWQRLNQYVAGLRDDLQRDTSFEWFQWLAERMIEREKAQPPLPAYLAYRDWE